MKQPHIVIIGGGFGGLTAAQELKNADAKVTLVDRTNHHLFQPLLYQVASAELAPRDVAFPIREILKKQANTSVIMDEVVSVDKKAQIILFKSGRKLNYDHLIVAVGTRHSYFGHPDWEENAPGLKTLEDAMTMKQKILTSLEAAEMADSSAEMKRLLTFVVVGGGPTGVELAGAIGEITGKAMLKDFRRIHRSDTQVFLIEAGPKLLNMYPQKLSDRARDDLVELGVTVLTDTPVTSLDAEGVHLDERSIPTNNVFWAAGNKAPSFLSSLDVSLDHQNRVIVEPDLSIPGKENVFVIGDAAHLLNGDGQPLPSLAPVAMQQGRYVARVIMGESRKPFTYRDRGSMATIGKAKAVASVGKWCFSGFFAWLMWSTIHITFLVGFRNKMMVMFEWFFWYIWGNRSSRLIYSKFPSKMKSLK